MRNHKYLVTEILKNIVPKYPSLEKHFLHFDLGSLKPLWISAELVP